MLGGGGGGGGEVWYNIDRHIIVISVDCVCSRCVVSCYVLVGVYHPQVLLYLPVAFCSFHVGG